MSAGQQSGGNEGVFNPLEGEKTNGSKGDEDKLPEAPRPLPFRENSEAIRENWQGEQEEAKREQGSKAGKPPPAKRVEFLSPLELVNYEIPEGYVLIGDYHVARGEVAVIGGAPGIGKSRAGTALAIAGATGKDWFGFKTHRQFKTLILQNENGRVRLKTEFEGMAQVDPNLINDWVRVSPPPPRGLDFQDVQFRHQFTEAIKTFAPDVVILDPWNAVAADETMRSYAEAYELIRSTLPSDNQPALVIVAHTRKPRMGERANGRALLNLLSGSYLLGSVARSVFILQAASDATEDQRVVFTCAKNNNGNMGPRSAWLRQNGLFDPVESFDWQEFEGGKGSGGGEAQSIVTEDHMKALFDYGARKLERREAVGELRRISGCGQTKAYDALKIDGEFAAMLRWYKDERKLGIVTAAFPGKSSTQTTFKPIQPPPDLNDPVDV